MNQNSDITKVQYPAIAIGQAGYDVTNCPWDSVEAFDTYYKTKVAASIPNGTKIRVTEGNNLFEYEYKYYGTTSGTWVKRTARCIVVFGGVTNENVTLSSAPVIESTNMYWQEGKGYFVAKSGTGYYRNWVNKAEFCQSTSDNDGLPYDGVVYVAGNKAYVGNDGDLVEISVTSGEVSSMISEDRESVLNNVDQKFATHIKAYHSEGSGSGGSTSVSVNAPVPSQRLRVMQWNIAHFTGGLKVNGKDCGITYEQLQRSELVYRQFFQKTKPDAICLNEYSATQNTTDKTTLAENMATKCIGTQYTGVVGNIANSGLSCNAIFRNARIKVLSSEQKMIADTGGDKQFYALKHKCTLNGASFVLCSVHLPSGGISTTAEYTAIANSIIEFCPEDVCIIAGDFNLYPLGRTPILTAFKNAGFLAINGEFLPKTQTMTFVDQRVPDMDHIFIKGCYAEFADIYTHIEYKEKNIDSDGDPVNFGGNQNYIDYIADKKAGLTPEQSAAYQRGGLINGAYINDSILNIPIGRNVIGPDNKEWDLSDHFPIVCDIIIPGNAPDAVVTVSSSGAESVMTKTDNVLYLVEQSS